MIINTTVNCNDWTSEELKIAVVEDSHWPIIGRDLFRQLGSFLNQSKQVNVKTQSPIHSKIRRVPINLIELVNTELKTLVSEKYIKKLNSCSYKYSN